MASWTLTNLLSVSNMTISGATLADGVFTYPAGVFCMITQPLPTPTAGHKYYGRVDQKVPAGTTFGDGRFEYFGGDGEGKHIVFTSFSAATMDNQWHTYSDVLSFPYLSGESWTLRSFTVSGSNTAYRRNHMIIDLTAAFGAGKEPTKDWCDRCIPFFEGNKTIESKPLVGVNGIARTITAGYVGVNGVARKIIAGYVGVNGVAKSIWGSRPKVIYKKYTIAGEWESYLIQEISKTFLGQPSFLYVSSPPGFQHVSETQPLFNFTAGALTGPDGLKQDYGTRAWAATDASIRENPQPEYYGHFALVTTAMVVSSGGVYTCRIYGTRKTNDVRGTLVDTVTAYAGEYPRNGIKDGFWWIQEGGEHFDTDKALDKGSLIDLSGWSTIEYLDVPAGCTNITIETGMASDDHDCLCEYDANKNYLSYWGAGANPRTFTFDYPEQIKFIRATFLTSAIDNCYIYDNTNGQYIWKGKNVA